MNRPFIVWGGMDEEDVCLCPDCGTEQPVPTFSDKQYDCRGCGFRYRLANVKVKRILILEGVDDKLKTKEEL